MPTIGIITHFCGQSAGLVQDGARQAAKDHGAKVLIYGSTSIINHTSLTTAQVMRWSGLGPKIADGFVFPMANPEMLKYAAELHASGHPVLLVTRRYGDIPHLMPDNVEIIVETVTELVARGHRRILFLKGPSDNYSANERLAAYRSACARTGAVLDDRLVVETNFDEQLAYKCIHKLIAAGTEFSAVIGGDDLCAIGALTALRENRIRVPEDVEVIGFNNSVRALLCDPPLTSCEFPGYQLGYKAVEQLVRNIRDREPLTSANLRGVLIRRASTRSATTTPAADGAPADSTPTADVGSGTSSRAADELAALVRSSRATPENSARASHEKLRELALQSATTEEQVIAATARALESLCLTRFGLFLADDPGGAASTGWFYWWEQQGDELKLDKQSIDLATWQPASYVRNEDGGLALMSLQFDNEQLGLLVIGLGCPLMPHDAAALVTLCLRTVRLHRELESIHKELVVASRCAGMAEVATGVLHNVGNALNSVNVSATVIATGLRRLKYEALEKTSALLSQHAADATEFLSRDPKGKLIPQFIDLFARQGTEEREHLLAETASLQKGIDHIKDIVSMQQSYASMAGAVETVEPASLMEDSLRMNTAALVRHDVRVVREFGDVPMVRCERPKVLQILINLIRNAKYACDESGSSEKIVTLRLEPGEGATVRLIVRDNGVGIPPENLTRIFNQGFTTRAAGHGFGLHSSALAAKEMKGSLTAESAGHLKGATFILQLPAGSPDA